MARRGSNLRAVVTSWTPPTVLAPWALTQVKIQMADRAVRTEGDGVRGQPGYEGAQVANESYGDRRVGGQNRDPVAPGHQEPGEVPEAPTRIGVRPTRDGNDGAQPGEHQGQKKRTDGRGGPIPPTLMPPKTASDAGSKKTPDPTMLPITSDMAIQRPIFVGSSLWDSAGTSVMSVRAFDIDQVRGPVRGSRRADWHGSGRPSATVSDAI